MAKLSRRGTHAARRRRSGASKRGAGVHVPPPSSSANFLLTDKLATANWNYTKIFWYSTYLVFVYAYFWSLRVYFCSFWGPCPQIPISAPGPRWGTPVRLYVCPPIANPWVRPWRRRRRVVLDGWWRVWKGAMSLGGRVSLSCLCYLGAEIRMPRQTDVPLHCFTAWWIADWSLDSLHSWYINVASARTHDFRHSIQSPEMSVALTNFSSPQVRAL